MSDGVRLDSDLQRLPGDTKAVHGGRKISVAVGMKMGCVQAIATFIGGTRPGEAALREHCSADASDARPPRVQALRARSVETVLATTRRHAEGDALRHDGRVLIQSQQLGGNQGARKRSDDAGRMKANLLKLPFGNRTKPRCDLHAENISRQ